ncbi:hypothetical protein DPEC_G00346720 [Dallia pectoralis]|uniref:Uncharacterized protein n=1 Tax=Dallia pectoralis TaxID=75939 RepID=A0ACC2F3W0_DALPE|nr:hypothetical protein DPEC_G00346720 [Dallia pectoralis]
MRFRLDAPRQQRPEADPERPAERWTHPDSNTQWQEDRETAVLCHWHGVVENIPAYSPADLDSICSSGNNNQPSGPRIRRGELRDGATEQLNRQIEKPHTEGIPEHGHTPCRSVGQRRPLVRS